MKVLEVSCLIGATALISATLGMLMAIMAMLVGNTVAFSEFVGWLCSFAFLFVCVVNWRSIAKNMGLRTDSSQEEVER